jgi:hypothetical protein
VETQPTAVSQTLSSNTEVEVTGTGLQLSGYSNCEMTVAGAISDICVIDSAETIRGSFTALGVP